MIGFIRGLFRFIKTIYLIHRDMAMRHELRGKKVSDPVFGELTYGERNWDGECELEAFQCQVPLQVSTFLGRPPSEAQQKVFKAFLADEERLVRDAERETFDYYKRIVEPGYLDLPDLKEPSELRETLTKPSLWIGLDDYGTPMSLEWEQPYPGKPKFPGFRYSVTIEDGEVSDVDQVPEWMKE